ncbi:hypothetical protein RN86_05695 [Streptococcus gordonii]|jgi:hypothetical protein|uniref:hypothetical protein n=1 Tax=Streptococcus gordonii TaxID=1302 RepID=UPI0006B250B4|nr:hypothetical protein [Streptococcus gordonii]ALD71916.1 hypothetical protein RN86_05695 [Streptococcus gordonii]
MAKQQTELLADDLMADSLQAENYLKQGRTCPLATIQLGLEDWLHHYLYRYQEASPDLRFKIFLYSSFYDRKVAQNLEGGDLDE